MPPIRARPLSAQFFSQKNFSGMLGRCDLIRWDKITCGLEKQVWQVFVGHPGNLCFLKKKSVLNQFGVLRQYRPRLSTLEFFAA
jgi:hypothetical protein